jgi:glycosyltransferase involved in cell wall biosynthesis
METFDLPLNGADQPDILYLGFLTGNGGDAMAMLDLATGIAARGRRVKLVVPELESSVALVELCRQRNLGIQRTPWIRSDERGVKQNLLSLFLLFGKHRAPLVHFHTGNICLPRSVVTVMRLMRLPRAIATLQGPYKTLRPGESRARAWANAVPNCFHRIVCPSEHSRRTQISLGVPSDLTQTIHNSVDIQRFASGNPLPPRQRLGVGPDTPLIVFTSRLQQQKRPLDALSAFQRIAASHPEAHLVFVGSGGQENELRSFATQNGPEGRVHFAGFQTNIQDWLAAATVWFLPTESENFSLAVLEAMAAGCPILSTMCQGNDEVLEPEVNSLATSVGDVEAQAQALDRLLTEPDLRRRLSSGARETAEKYSVGKMVDEYARLYDSISRVRER